MERYFEQPEEEKKPGTTPAGFNFSRFLSNLGHPEDSHPEYHYQVGVTPEFTEVPRT